MSAAEAAAEHGGNVYDKYGTRNPVARRLMAGFTRDLDALVDRTGADEGHEVGCGEGELALMLARFGAGHYPPAEDISEIGRARSERLQQVADIAATAHYIIVKPADCLHGSCRHLR